AGIVTARVEGLTIPTEEGDTYHATGACQCKAYQVGQACKHRAAARLVQMMNEEEAPAASPSLPTITRQEMQAQATGEQRAQIETLVMRIKKRGDNYTLCADGKDILVDDGKLWRVNRKGKLTFDDIATAPIVKPQPEGTYYNGWNI